MAGILTRTQAESVVISRTRTAMTLAGLSMTSPSADLNDPLATALDELGQPPGDRSLVVDADLAVFGPNLQGRLLDLFEIRTLETAVQQLLGRPKSIQWEDYRKDQGDPVKELNDLIAMKWKRYQARWAQTGTLVVGHMVPQNRWLEDKAGHYPPDLQTPPCG